MNCWHLKTWFSYIISGALKQTKCKNICWSSQNKDLPPVYLYKSWAGDKHILRILERIKALEVFWDSSATCIFFLWLYFTFYPIRILNVYYLSHLSSPFNILPKQTLHQMYVIILPQTKMNAYGWLYSLIHFWQILSYLVIHKFI